MARRDDLQNRWWIYQRERFPVFAHGLLIAAFSFSAISFSSLLRGDVSLSNPKKFIVGFLTAFIFFLQLRISDEFKDNEEDSKYRPYRPVPRGLVKLSELAFIGIGGGCIQLILALWLDYRIVPFLLFVWLYMLLMSKEFFVCEWIKRQPVIYMATHMIIIPFIDFYAASCDWRPVQNYPPTGLAWFIGASFFNGMVVEIGRKLRAPEQEETGVETYTFLWGRKKAILSWLTMMGLTGICVYYAANEIHFTLPATFILAAVFILSGVLGMRFLHMPVPSRSKVFEPVSGLWTLSLYLSLGAFPLIWFMIKR